MHRRIPVRYSIFLVLVVINLAVLACGTAPETATPMPATKETRPAEEIQPAEEPQPTQEIQPTEEPRSTDEGSEEATNEPEQSTQGITAENVGNLHEIRKIDVSHRELLAVALSPTAPQGATFGRDLYVRIWNTNNGNMIYQMEPHAAEGWGLAYSPDGTKLASGGGHEVILWDPATGKKIKSITVSAYVYRLNWSPDGRRLAVVGKDSSKIDLVDVELGSVQTRISTSAGNELWAAVYSPDGSWMAVGDVDGNITILDAASAEIASEDSATAQGSIWDLEFSPDSKLLVGCNGGGDLYFWDTASWAAIPELIKRDVHTDPNPELSGCKDGVFSKNGAVYFSAGADKVLNIWDATNGRLLHSLSFEHPIGAISIAGDDRLLGVVLSDGSFHILGTD
ncbi:MAG: hypothetical protein JXB30_15820 [Anaerolineae bacterium]|nr:hypothetical protein [Anaerolineae bacterium]